MTREFVRDTETGLVGIFTEEDRKSGKVTYCLRVKNDQSPNGLIRIVPKDIRPAVLVRAISVGYAGGYGEIDGKDLKNKCPKDYNAYISGEAVEFSSSPTVHIIDNHYRSKYPLGDNNKTKIGYRLINFCRVTMPK